MSTLTYSSASVYLFIKIVIFILVIIFCVLNKSSLPEN